MAATVPGGSRSVSFRLPEWVIDYLASRAEASQVTKTQVVIEAVTCLRERELFTAMQEGYRDRAAEAIDFAEASLPAAAETLPEW